MSNKTRIAYVVPSLKVGGPSTQLSMIVENSSKLFDVEIFALSLEATEISMRQNFAKLGVGVTYLEGNLINKRQKLMKILKRGDYSLLHSQGLLPDLLLASLSIQTPWLVSIRNYAYEDYVLKFGGVKGRLLARLHFTAFRYPHTLVACSKYIQHCCQRHGILSSVIRNGVDLNPVQSEAKQRTRTKDKQILVVGSLIARKNNLPILNAHSKLAGNKAYRLIFLGDGSDRKELERNAHPNVEFKGQVKDVRRYYQQADLYISNSLSEGMPNSVLEAIAHNVRCLISDIPPHRELAAEFPELVSIIDENMSIEELSSEMETQLNKPTVKYGTQKIEKISARFMADQYVKTYRKIIHDALQ